jgi:hypothetical protein
MFHKANIHKRSKSLQNIYIIHCPVTRFVLCQYVGIVIGSWEDRSIKVLAKLERFLLVS